MLCRVCLRESMLMMTGLLPLKFWVTDPANLFPSRSQRDTWKQGRWKQREKQGQHEQRHWNGGLQYAMMTPRGCTWIRCLNSWNCRKIWRTRVQNWFCLDWVFGVWIGLLLHRWQRTTWKVWDATGCAQIPSISCGLTTFQRVDLWDFALFRELLNSRRQGYLAWVGCALTCKRCPQMKGIDWAWVKFGQIALGEFCLESKRYGRSKVDETCLNFVYGKLWKSHTPRTVQEVVCFFRSGHPTSLAWRRSTASPRHGHAAKALGFWGLVAETVCDLEFEAPRSAIKTKGREFFSILKRAFSRFLHADFHDRVSWSLLTINDPCYQEPNPRNKRFSDFHFFFATFWEHFQEQERQRESAWLLSWLHWSESGFGYTLWCHRFGTANSFVQYRLQDE